jgi:uncharacterized membrane protein
MVKKLYVQFFLLCIMFWLMILPSAAAQSSDDPVVRAILFYSPTCPHCHDVISEVLLPMIDDYGSDRLQIIGIDTTQPAGGQVYQMTIEKYQIPSHRQGVPTLVIGDVVLVGSSEIPEQFPGLVEEGLETGGIDWPEIPGLDQVILSEVQVEPSPSTEAQSTATPVPTPAAEAAATIVPTPVPTQAPTPTSIPGSPALTLGEEGVSLAEAEGPPPDPAGFAIAGVVLIGMAVAVAYVVCRVIIAWQRLFQLDGSPDAYAQTWGVPILALLGLGVSIYLAYVEISHVQAVCGPVGECNIVQASPYAQILGIPIAVLGILNYLAILVLWTVQRYAGGRLVKLSAFGLLGLTLAGTLFSIYLTCLELFVIRAVCAWCLSSAVITTLLMLLAAIPITGRASRSATAGTSASLS